MFSRLRLMLGTFLLVMGQHSLAAAEDTRLTVIELFTSQGCSSCPPADVLLKQYAKRPDIIALSMPVDYWDYLGWKDTLASPSNTLRQRAYATKRGDGEVYTPQAVINGLAHAVGSHSAEIDKAIAATTQELASQSVKVRATVTGRSIAIQVGATPTGDRAWATVWLGIVQPKVEVDVKMGENKGKRIAYLNVVRQLTPVGAWKGAETRIELPEDALIQPGDRGVVLLQSGEGGRILGASWVQPN